MSTIRILALIAAVALVCAAEEPQKRGSLEQESDYLMEQPGTITFTQGITIVGKVEKPQVMIFLPKEKTYNRETSFVRSFAEDIAEPMSFEPLFY